ncbi:MAG TPA: alpha/beta fold hydrolase, partial [Thermodesulfobacteriota bacterium]
MTRPLLVLVPGLLCDRDLWRDQIPALSAMAEVRVPDLRPFDSIEDMARSILDAAPGAFALAGLSMGGYVALEVMRRAPGRVTRLALLNTTSRPDTEAQTARRR